MKRALMVTAVVASLLLGGAAPALADHGGGHAGDPPGSLGDPVVNPGVACDLANEASGGVSGATINGHPGTGRSGIGYETCGDGGGED